MARARQPGAGSHPTAYLRVWRWVPLSGLGLAVLVGLLLAWAPWSTGGGGIPDAFGAPSSAVPLPASSGVPSGYHIVYRVQASDIAPYTEDLWVQRPFDSLDQTRSGPPPGTAMDLATLSRLGDEVLATGHSQPALIHVAVSPGAQDPRLDAVAPAAEAAGLLSVNGTGTVLGSPCRIYRSSEPLGSTGPLAAVKGGNYVLSCVDSRGLVLADAVYKNSRLTQLRLAVKVSVGAAAGAGNYSMTAAATPFNEGGGSFQALTLSSAPPQTSWSPSWLPPGFTHYGRYAVVPSQPQLFDQSGSTSAGQLSPSGLPDALVTELDDAYVSGANLIVVQQGVTIGGSIFKAPTGGAEVDLGPLMGRGQLLLSPTASSVNAEPDGGARFVRISGTVAPSVLLRVARSLRTESPGTLVPAASS